MTNEEAIEIFKRLKENAPNEMHLETVGTAQELFEMAIQALSQESEIEENIIKYMKKYPNHVGNIDFWEGFYACRNVVLQLDDEECSPKEQEPKSITREAIEDYVCNYLTDTAKAQEILNALQDMEQMIHALPSVTHKSGKWIPVSERLPEIDEPVLIFQRYYSGLNITIGRYHSDEEQGGYKYWQWIKYDSNFSYGIDHFGIICPDSYYVDAWMPLPEPYEPQESEDKE